MEAEFLSDLRIESLDGARRAAERIHRLGAAAVIVKGGHLAGPEAIDLLFDGRQHVELRSERIEARSTHGTGCTFAAALAAHLALGHPLQDAARRAKEYVTGAIRHGLSIGRGHGPLDHFWNHRTPPPI
jgi:hydroxymethylpyrimidine/phosphomethylpyrimidine kinase